MMWKERKSFYSPLCFDYGNMIDFGQSWTLDNVNTSVVDIEELH